MQRLPEGALVVSVDDRELRITNWDKVLFPQAGFTKGDLIAYYTRIAPVVLPHLHDRPLTLKRYPNGVEAPYFYEKQSPSHRPSGCSPSGSATSSTRSRRTARRSCGWRTWRTSSCIRRCRWPGLRTGRRCSCSTSIRVPSGIVECCEVALVLNGLFTQPGLQSFAKSSGSKGLQVYLPLNVPVTYQQTKPLAKRIAELLEQRMPELVVSRMTKRLRPGKVLVDWSQNDAHKTTVNVYSVRARERPSVSTPVSWEEVTACREQRDERLLTFEADEVLERVARLGDLFAPVLSLQQALPALG